MYGRPGISVIRGTGMDAPYQLLKWPEAARRIGRLVKDGLYLTDEEEQQYPEWKREKSGAKVESRAAGCCPQSRPPRSVPVLWTTPYTWRTARRSASWRSAGDASAWRTRIFRCHAEGKHGAFAALLRADTRNAQLLPPGPASGQAVYTEAPRDLSLPFSGDRYLDLKDQYNRYALGCGNDAYFLVLRRGRARCIGSAAHKGAACRCAAAGRSGCYGLP